MHNPAIKELTPALWLINVFLMESKIQVSRPHAYIKVHKNRNNKELIIDSKNGKTHGRHTACNRKVKVTLSLSLSLSAHMHTCIYGCMYGCVLHQLFPIYNSILSFFSDIHSASFPFINASLVFHYIFGSTVLQLITV